MLNIGVLISGSGSNLQSLIDACALDDFPVNIKVVICNKHDAYGIQRAKDAGIETVCISHKDYSDREAFDRQMHHVLEDREVEFVCLAGFMRLLSPWFAQQWHNKMVNIHPSLLPSFKGINAQQQALDYGVKIAGCTLHFVRSEMDTGPIILQAAVEVKSDDTFETLRDRILEQEHRIYVQGLKMIASGQVKVDGDQLVYQ